MPQIDLSKWKESVQGCQIGDKQVAVGESSFPSPCTSCICSAEGVSTRMLKNNMVEPHVTALYMGELNNQERTNSASCSTIVTIGGPCSPNKVYLCYYRKWTILVFLLILKNCNSNWPLLLQMKLPTWSQTCSSILSFYLFEYSILHSPYRKLN